MKRFFSIGVLLQSIAAVMAVGSLIFCGLGARQAFERRQTDERVLHIVGVSRDLFTVLQEIRLERGTLNNSLALTTVVPATGSAGFRARRDAGDQAFDEALAGLANDPSPETRAMLPDIAQRRQVFDAVRDEVEAAVKRP